MFVRPEAYDWSITNGIMPASKDGAVRNRSLMDINEMLPRMRSPVNVRGVENTVYNTLTLDQTTQCTALCRTKRGER
jgi:hypothetical protein